MQTTTVRLGRADETARLQDIQCAAGVVFREVGMAAIADNPPLSHEVLAAHCRDGHLFVAADADDTAIGFAMAEILDDEAHLEQVSVHPDHARRGIGRLLIDRVDAWAADRGDHALSLVTFRAVAWNAPYYQRLGFRELPADRWGPQLAASVASEAAFGIDPRDRVVLHREVGGAASRPGPGNVG